MMTNKFNRIYWESRYAEQKIGWDLGQISKPLKTYIDQLTDTSMRILIPGAGHCYEAEYLWKNGFRNVFIVDIAAKPLRHFEERVPDFPKNQLLNIDFFELKGEFDLIIEQTFFCALDPVFRTKYVNKMHNLLNENGKLTGLLFNFERTEIGPPFGGSILEYEQLFVNKFTIKTLETATNSVKERTDKELFFIFEKKTLCH